MRPALTLLATAGLATAAIAWQSVNQLQHDGKTISTNLRVVDGTLMVSVKDVAAYLGGTLNVQNGTATIAGDGVTSNTSPGAAAFNGAAQPFTGFTQRPEPKQRTAKVGDSVDEDGLALTVLGVDRVEKGNYRTTFDPRGRHISPTLKGDQLVVVRMRLENTGAETRRAAMPSAYDVTLFDETGVGTPLRAFDLRPTGDIDANDELNAYTVYESPLLASKGAIEFAAVFSLPKDRSPRSLALSLAPSQSNAGGTNLRVDL